MGNIQTVGPNEALIVSGKFEAVFNRSKHSIEGVVRADTAALNFPVKDGTAYGAS